MSTELYCSFLQLSNFQDQVYSLILNKILLDLVLQDFFLLNFKVMSNEKYWKQHQNIQYFVGLFLLLFSWSSLVFLSINCEKTVTCLHVDVVDEHGTCMFINNNLCSCAKTSVTPSRFSPALALSCQKKSSLKTSHY